MNRSERPGDQYHSLVASAPRFQRPNRDHALECARTLFLNGERVDMNTVCAELGIGRTTLHRWVGDRELLIGEVFAELTDQVWDACIAAAEGEGAERALDAGRRYMEITAGFEPLRRFAERETQLALRVLLAPDGLVAQRIRAGFTRALEANGVDVDPELVDIAVQAGTALEWGPIAIGGEPEIDRAGRLIRALFETAQARASV
jgi:AcrR family transcriptional regulator